jgi:DNA-binding transcriptional regulator YdaS (Cro superfamily)
MTPKQAVSHWNKQVTLAKVLGVSPQVVNNWLRRGKIPLNHQLTLFELSLGELKIDRQRRTQTELRA